MLKQLTDDTYLHKMLRGVILNDMQLTGTTLPNKALQPTANPLRGLFTAELGR